MPIEWSMKSNLPPKCSIVLSIRFSRSSTLVASAGTTIVLHFSASRPIVPMRIDTAVFVRTISAPSSTARSATFHAIDCSLSAPKIRPFLPFNKLYAILFRLKIRANITKIFETGEPPSLQTAANGMSPNQNTGCKSRFFHVLHIFRLFIVPLCRIKHAHDHYRRFQRPGAFRADARRSPAPRDSRRPPQSRSSPSPTCSQNPTTSSRNRRPARAKPRPTDCRYSRPSNPPAGRYRPSSSYRHANSHSRRPKNCSRYNREKRLSITAIYGGAAMSEQLRRLAKGIDIVVGTPGRVLDHIRRGTMKLENVRYLVLDEADEMLNMGFVGGRRGDHEPHQRRAARAALLGHDARAHHPAFENLHARHGDRARGDTSNSRPTSRNRSISRCARPTSSTP